jgi:hypothetical protein
VAYDNINFSKSNMAVVDGYFYMFDDTDTKLVQKTGGGDTVFEYPLDTVISDLSEVISTQYDGTYFWTLQRLESTDEPYVRKWLIENNICKLKSEFIHSQTSFNTYYSDAFCVEHYITNITNSLSVGDSVLQIDGYYDNVVSSGTVLSLGPNVESEREDVTVSGVIGNNIYVTSNLNYSYDSGDQVSITPSYFLFNDYVGTTESGCLMRFRSLDGSYMYSDVNEDYKSVNNSIFHRLQNVLSSYPDAHSIIYIKGTNAKLINMSSIIETYSASTVNDDFTGVNGSAPNSDNWEITAGNPEIYDNSLKLETTYGGIERITSKYLCMQDFDVMVSGTYDSYTSLSGSTRSTFKHGLGLLFPYASGSTFEIGIHVEAGVPSSNIVAEYLMDNVSDTYVYDTSGNSYNGTIYGLPTQTSGIIGNALTFSGTGSEDSVELLDNTTASLYQDLFSISLWFKSETTSGHASARIITRDCSDYYCLLIAQNTGFPQSLTFYYSTNQSTSLGALVEEDTWHHVVMSWDVANSKVRLVLDNVEQFSTTSFSSFTISSRPIVLACNTESVISPGTYSFEGSIDDVRFYDKYLSDEEIDLLYDGSIKSFPDAPVYVYTISDGEYTSYQLLTSSGIIDYKLRFKRVDNVISSYYKTTISGSFEDPWNLCNSVSGTFSDCKTFLIDDSTNMRSRTYFDDFIFNEGTIKYFSDSVPYYGTMNIDNVRSDNITTIPIEDLGIYGDTLYRLQGEATYYGSDNDWSPLYNYQTSVFRPFVDFISLESDPDILPATGRNAAILTAVVLDQYGEGVYNKPVTFSDDDDVGYITTPFAYTDNFFGTGEAFSSYMSGLDIRIVTVQATATQYD